MGTVGGNSDRIENLALIREQLVAANPDLKTERAESLDKKARDTALAKGRELAKEEVKQKGEVGTLLGFTLIRNLLEY